MKPSELILIKKVGGRGPVSLPEKPYILPSASVPLLAEMLCEASKDDERIDIVNVGAVFLHGQLLGPPS
ncbi:MAG: hypothetical protein EON54_27900 [Alcaligenaceae bacterium]|nr:MAG: hypothetical protein EON54_27900 [Alcaligenaceae bacterium]